MVKKEVDNTITEAQAALNLPVDTASPLVDMIGQNDDFSTLYPSGTEDPPLTPSSLTKALNGDALPLANYDLNEQLALTEKEVDPEPEAKHAVGKKPQKALAVRKGKKAAPKRPAFVMKLWNMVNDESNSKYISWMHDGKSFQVNDRESFMRYVLPKYFKHNNFASFVRQLNMYGWHKIQDVTSGSLIQGDEVWQFENPNFVRDREDLLDRIVRNKPAKETEEENVDISSLMSQLEAMRKSQKLIEDDLRRVRMDNEMLWKENYLARERHKAQAETLKKILRFLATVYGNNSTKFLESIAAASQDPNPDQSSTALQSPAPFNYYTETSPYQAAPSTPQTASRRLMISNKAYSPDGKYAIRPPGSITTVPSSTDLQQQQQQGIDGSTDATGVLPEIQEIHRGPENRNGDLYHGGSLAASPQALFPDFPTTPQIQYQPLDPTMSVPVSQAPAPVAQSDAAMSPDASKLLGNIHTRLDRNQGTLRQVNDWISKLSGKPSDEVLSGNDDLNDLLNSQSFSDSLSTPKLNEMYNDIGMGPDFTQPSQPLQPQLVSQPPLKRKRNSKDGTSKRRK